MQFRNLTCNISEFSYYQVLLHFLMPVTATAVLAFQLCERREITLASSSSNFIRFWDKRLKTSHFAKFIFKFTYNGARFIFQCHYFSIGYLFSRSSRLTSLMPIHRPHLITYQFCLFIPPLYWSLWLSVPQSHSPTFVISYNTHSISLSSSYLEMVVKLLRRDIGAP